VTTPSFVDSVSEQSHLGHSLNVDARHEALRSDVSFEPVAAAAPRPEPVIEVIGVHKLYAIDDGVVHALDDVNFEVSSHEIVTLIGRSGCGKSTLLNMLAGLDAPSAGQVLYRGEEVRGPLFRQVGYVFQQPVLLPWRTVIDNVVLGVELMKLSPRSRMSRARDLLDMVGLSGVEKQFPHQLSGGMQQRAAIVRAMMHEPGVLLMDEPFGALDAMTREHMNEQLLEIQRRTGTTIVFVTHDLREAAYLSDRIVVMTPRPGTVKTIVNSTLPKDRSHDVLYSDEFKDLAHELHRLII
jgi:NitT/TauT family transport system ATP-binding protein